MPACSKAKNPQGIEIIFTEEDHRYTSIINGKEIEYISGTTFLDRYFPEFDPTGEITERCAKKQGVSVKELKKMWRDKADKACVFGTKLHETVEDCRLGREYRNSYNDQKEKICFEYAKKVGKKLLKSLDIIGIEKIVFNPELKIAGTIDLLGRSKKTGKYIIVDHKTNEKTIDESNKYNSFCLDPISNIPDTSFGHYSLQLNLYSYLLKEGGYVDKDAEFEYFLDHITVNGVKMIKLPDLQREIKLVINDYRKNLEK